MALQTAFPQSDVPDGATFRFGFTHDYLFVRLPGRWESDLRTLESRFGSDHHPLLALVRQPAGV
jgi:endonuclease/exonuclease/phosphatase (EEP) superfamily protein YafD